MFISYKANSTCSGLNGFWLLIFLTSVTNKRVLSYILLINQQVNISTNIDLEIIFFKNIMVYFFFWFEPKRVINRYSEFYLFFR
jgi:hypothetical protein